MNRVKKHVREKCLVHYRSCLTVVLVLALAVLLVSVPPALAGPSATSAASSSAPGQGLGMTLSPPDPTRKISPSRYGASGLAAASSVDFSSSLPPIGNQGPHQSCVGWSVGYYAKSWYEKAEHPSWNLSDPSYQMSAQYLWNGVNGGLDRGTSIDSAFNYLEQSGCTDMQEFPYDGDAASLPSAEAVEAAKQYRISTDWGYFFLQQSWGPFFGRGNVVSGLKSWLATGKPVVLGIMVYDDFPDHGSNPNKSYYDYNGSADRVGGHAVIIAGYNDNANPSGGDANHRGGFLMVNSWGNTWNGNGKVYLSYDFIQNYVPEAWYMNDYLDSSPTVSSMSPAGAGAGQIVTIKGNNFGARRRAAHVGFQGSAASNYVSWMDDEIKVRVPSHARSGNVGVADLESEQSNSRQIGRAHV